MDNYENGYKKSSNVKKIKYKGKTYSIDTKALTKFIAQSTLAIVLSGAALVSVVGMASDNLNDFKNDRQIKSEYVQLLNENTHRTDDTKGYWYDFDAIAKGLLTNSEDFELQLYCIYDQIGYNEANKIECMNNLFREINIEISKDIEKYKDFEIYENFEHYLKVNGYTSKKVYEHHMNKMIETKMNVKEGSSSWKK